MKMRLFEEIILDEMKELEPGSRKQWAEALGYNSPQAIWGLLKRLVEAGLVSENRNKSPFIYEVELKKKEELK